MAKNRNTQDTTLDLINIVSDQINAVNSSVDRTLTTVNVIGRKVDEIIDRHDLHMNPNSIDLRSLALCKAMESNYGSTTEQINEAARKFLGFLTGEYEVQRIEELEQALMDEQLRTAQLQGEFDTATAIIETMTEDAVRDRARIAELTDLLNEYAPAPTLPAVEDYAIPDEAPESFGGLTIIESTELPEGGPGAGIMMPAYPAGELEFTTHPEEAGSVESEPWDGTAGQNDK